jgi:hypothetical protein
VETAAGVEIGVRSLRRYSLDDFHNLLGKASAGKTLRLSHSFPSADGHIKTPKPRIGNIFSAEDTLMVAMEIRKDGGFPQPRVQTCSPGLPACGG